MTERSDSTIRQSTFDIRHSNVVSHEVSALSPAPKKSADLIEIETLKKRISNIEQEIKNVEVRNPIDFC